MFIFGVVQIFSLPKSSLEKRVFPDLGEVSSITGNQRSTDISGRKGDQNVESELS